MAIVIPYTKQTWTDGSGGGTPLSAARMGVLEEGILDVSRAPAVRVYHNTTQSINNITDTALAFNSERFDQAGGAASTQHDTSTNNNRLTCLYAGIYLITGHIEFANNATGARYCRIRHQGTTFISEGVTTSAAVDGLGRCQTTTIYSLAVNEYVELIAWQSSGGALNVVSGANVSPEFMMVRVG